MILCIIAPLQQDAATPSHCLLASCRVACGSSQTRAFGKLPGACKPVPNEVVQLLTFCTLLSLLENRFMMTDC